MTTPPPKGAVAYKFADPTEGARWVDDLDEAIEIHQEDPSLLRWVASCDLCSTVGPVEPVSDPFDPGYGGHSTTTMRACEACAHPEPWS
jgi:hypothetical protein